MKHFQNWQAVFTTTFLFDYQGRVSRGQNAVFFVACYLLSSLADQLDLAIGSDLGIPLVTFGITQLLLTLALLYPSSCVSIKRWHDRNKSAWWGVVLLLSIIGILWLLIEPFFFAGTPGANRYGPDPRELA